MSMIKRLGLVFMGVFVSLLGAPKVKAMDTAEMEGASQERSRSQISRSKNIAQSSLNNPYMPDWANEDDILTLSRVFKDCPEYVNPFKSYAAWHYHKGNVDNPNAFRIFFSSFEKKKVALRYWKEKLEDAINETNQILLNYDTYYSEDSQKRISDEEELAKKNPYFLKRAENLKITLNDPLTKDSEKKKVEEKLKKLHIWKNEFANPDLFPIIEPQSLESIITIPYDEEPSQVSWRKGEKKYKLNTPSLPVIIIDDFEQDPSEKKSSMKNPSLKGRILFETLHEQIISMEHSAHVSGIVGRLAPAAQLIPKMLGAFQETLDNTVKNILQNDYGAKVINISAHIRDVKSLQALCQNHIVIVSAGNYSVRFPSVFSEAIKDENTRKHLLVAVNTMPDGQTISPTSNIPSGPEEEAITVSAPGTWVYSTLPLPSKEEAAIGFSKGYRYPQHGEMTGTSQAAPVVSTVALRLLAQFPELSLEQVVKIIKDSANKEGELAKRYLFGNGLVDVDAAETMARGLGLQFPSS